MKDIDLLKTIFVVRYLKKKKNILNRPDVAGAGLF